MAKKRGGGKGEGREEGDVAGGDERGREHMREGGVGERRREGRTLQKQIFLSVLAAHRPIYLVFARFGSRMVRVCILTEREAEAHAFGVCAIWLANGSCECILTEREAEAHTFACTHQKRERKGQKFYIYKIYIYIYIYIYLYMCIFAHSHGAQPAHKALVEASTTMDVISVCASEDERELT